MGVPQPHLELAPLLTRSGCDHATVSTAVSSGTYHEGVVHQAAPQTVLAELLGVSRRAVSRWAMSGVPLRSAEDACDRLGIHPCEVWGDDWIDAALPEIPA